MTTLTHLAQQMQTLLTTTANAAALTSGFQTRTSKITGAVFVQTLVWGWLANPDATLQELAQAAAALQVRISAQALDQRFDSRASALLLQVLNSGLNQLVTAPIPALELLKGFSGLYLLDSSSLNLPAALASQFPGCGKAGSANAAGLKVHTLWELGRGALKLELSAASQHDAKSKLAQTLVASGGLVVRDLGYLDLNYFSALKSDGSYFISRVKADSQLVATDGRAIKVADWLGQFPSQVSRLDLSVTVGIKARLECRLVAVRAPAKISRQRHTALKETARKRQAAISAEQLALAEWSVYITNTTSTQLSLEAVVALYRWRWQIELLFKLWKQYGHLDESRSQQPERVLSEMYAKLLGVLIQHWLVLVTCWEEPARSLVQASRTIRKFAQTLGLTLASGRGLRQLLARLKKCSGAGCRVNTRRQQPASHQRLRDPVALALA